MKSFAAILVVSIASPSLLADQYTNSKSPDKSFALLVVREDQQPYLQSDTIIHVASKKAVTELDRDHPFDPEGKLLWSGDSQWVAYWHHPEENDYDSGTRVFARDGSAFFEQKLPELPISELSGTVSAAEKRFTRIKPLRWSKPGLLDLEIEVIAETGGRGAMNVAIQFDRKLPPAIVKAEKEPISVVDYFLLLPKEDFEAPPLAWLDHNARVIDKENGYLSISGDGAQPSFDVALFRYHDGRPLIAVCSGELEGPDSVQLKFYELGSDRRMHEVPSAILPFPGLANEDNEFKFELPRQGRTIAVRKLKTGKLLHRFTWDGDKFVQIK